MSSTETVPTPVYRNGYSKRLVMCSGQGSGGTDGPTNAPQPAVCGNGVIEKNEECDPPDINGVV